MNPLNQAQADFLIQTLARQLRCDPNQLRQQLQSKNIGGLTSSMDADSARQLKSVLSNPQQLQQMMNSPEMKELLRKIQGKQA